MDRIAAKCRIDGALNYVAQRTSAIFQAHEELGVPLDDLLCYAVRKAFEIGAVDMDAHAVSGTQGPSEIADGARKL